MSLSQGRLDGTRVVGLGKYKSEIPISLWKRHNLMTHGYADRNVGNTCHRPSGLKAMDIA